MPSTAYVYVPAPSRRNLEIGLAEGLWGWRTPTLDRADARAAVQSLAEGDFLVLAHKGPDCRVKPGEWSHVGIKRVVVTRVTSPYFTDDSEVWPDDVYPERIGLDILTEETDVQGPTLGDAAMEALRLSANKQGAALVTDGIDGVVRFAATTPSSPSPGDTGHVELNGPDSEVAQVLVRREQAKLRRKMLNGAIVAACALCGRTLPTRYIRAAHIKRRAHATPLERRLMANIMPACLLGCDELFEHGHIVVDDNGVIQARPRPTDTADLLSAAEGLQGRVVNDFGPDRAGFYAWHRENSPS
ncbi:hypothetical protein ACFC26_43705 [Kitasatospora purpeofusca]|uniref:hypothetical protein n=1 Tax=Kitasatospora purpeofusca TaxID=67352 RepID=UPI0035E39911